MNARCDRTHITSLPAQTALQAELTMDMCQGLTGEEKVVRRFGLLNPSTMRPVYYKNQADKSKLRQADIELSFRLQTRTAPHSTQESVEHIAMSVWSLVLCCGSLDYISRPLLFFAFLALPFTEIRCSVCQTSSRHHLGTLRRMYRDGIGIRRRKCLLGDDQFVHCIECGGNEVREKLFASLCASSVGD